VISLTIDTFWVWMVVLAVVALYRHNWYFRWWKRHNAFKTDGSIDFYIWKSDGQIFGI